MFKKCKKGQKNAELFLALSFSFGIYFMRVFVVFFFTPILLPLIYLKASVECIWISQAAKSVKNPPAVQETWVQSLSQEDPLEKEWATHSSVLAWEIPWTEL